MKTKLEEFISNLEDLLLSLEKTRETGVSSDEIDELRKKHIPVLKKTSAKFPHANDNEVASWAVSFIVIFAPWIIYTVPYNKKIANYLRELKPTDLDLSEIVKNEFYGKFSQFAHKKNSAKRVLPPSR